MSALVFLLGISIFVSKSGISIFGVLLLVASFFPHNFALIKKNKVMWLIASLFPIALITNYFSLGELDAVFKVVESWPWPLFAIPSALIVARPELRKWLIRGLLAGLIIALGKAFWNYYFVFQLETTKDSRVTSFWDIGRWAVFLGVTIVSLYWYIINNNKYRIYIFILLLTSIFVLILNNSRAPWIATVLAVLLVSASSKRALGYLVAVTIAISAMIFSVSGFRERALSIVSVKSANGILTSDNDSNAGRLHMWKVALDFYKEHPWFGTGIEMSERPMREFLSRQSAEYLKKYTSVEFSYHDQHSSYLGLLVKMGLVFTGIYFFIIFYLLAKVIRKRKESKLNWLILAISVFHLTVFVFYSSFDSYDMISFFPIFVWGNFSQLDS